MFRKSLAWLLALCMVLTLVPFTAFATDESGTGAITGSDSSTVINNGNTEDTDTTVEADLIISTADELVAFSAAVTAGDTYVGKIVRLCANIDLSGIEWAPIGGENVYFAGEFDGAGYTISNLTQTTGARMGLFGLVKKAYIHDVTLKNVSFTVAENGARVGAVAGNLQYWNVVEDVTIDGINLVVNGNDGLIGAVAGYVWKSQLGNVDVKNAVITVNGTGNVVAGNTGYGRAHVWDTGVTGNNAHWLDGTVQTIDGTEYVLQNYFVDCDVDSVKITLNGTGSEAGGFFGSDTYNSHSNYFVDCHVTGLDVVCAEGTSQLVGGFIAWNNGTTSAGTVKGFDGCSVSGTIIGADGTYGGFAGQVGGRACDYNNASADVDITCTGTAGGFVGITQAYSTHKYTFNNCTATGDVSGDVAGGFAGKNGMGGDGKSVFVTYNGCTAEGAVVGTTYAGGLIGEVNTELPATNWNIVDGIGDLTLISNVASTNVTVGTVGALIGYLDGVANGDAKEGNTLSVKLINNTPNNGINVSADTIEEDIEVINAVASVNGEYFDTLAEAVAAANAVEGGATVVLLADVTLGEKLTISGNVTVTGAYTITRADDYTGTLFAVNAGATLTLDGGLVIDGGNNYAFDADAYKADLETMTRVDSVDAAQYFTPEDGAPVAAAYMITASGTVNLNNVTVKNNYSTGSGIVSASNGAVVTLTGAQITHNAITSGSGLVVNAAAGVYDVNGNNAIIVTMNDGTVIDGNHVGGNHGVFKIYSGTVFTMNGGKITNTTGWNSNGVAVGVYWAAFTMNGGTICSNSSVYGPNNGRNAAVYLHSASQFVMNDGTICHNSGRSRGGIDAPYTGTEGNAATVVINGGTVTDNVSIYGNADPDVYGGERLTITGGTFTQDVSRWLAPDLGVSYNEDTGRYTVNSDIWEVIFTVVDTDGVETSRDPQYFANLNDLLDSYNDWVSTLDTSAVYSAAVKLMSDVKIDEIVDIDLLLTLDLNGKTVTAVTGESGYSDAFRILADVTVIGNGTVDADESGYAFFVGNDTTAGKLTIKNGSFYGAVTAAQVTKGELIIEGGYFEATAYNGAYDFTLNCKDAFYQAGEAKITVTGGTFSNFNPADNKAEGTGTDFVAAGYESVDNGDGTWGIVSSVASVTDSEENVTYYAALQQAIDAANSGDTVKLLCNVVVTESVVVADDDKLTLDLNGHKITNEIPSTASVFHTISNQGDLTVIDSVGGGVIESNSAKGYVIYTDGGSLVVDGAKLVGINQGYAVVSWTDGDSITIEEGTVIEGRGALYIDGGATAVVNGGTFTMTVQTTNPQDNVVYVGRSSVLTVNGGTFTTGDITGTKRTAIAATGTSTVTINGGNFYGLTADLYTNDTAAINVSGGTFTGVGFDNQSGGISLTGGTYSYDPNAYCHADYAGIENGNGTWTVVKYVEWIKEQLLAGNDVTLIKDVVVDGSDIDSISAPTNGNGAYLNAGIFNVVGDYDVTFDLNGHTITYVGHVDYLCGVNDKFSGNSCKIAHGLFFANNGAKLTVKGEGNVIVHGVASGVYAASPNSVITVEGGNWYNDGCENCGASNFFLYASHGGELYIKGGRFEQALDSDGDSHLILEHGGSASNAVVDFSLTKIVVSGGTFVGMNPEEALYAAQNSWSSIEWGTTGVVAEGYYAISVEGEDNTWTIGEAVAINVETGKGYGDVTDALDDAAAGQTVKMLKDYEEAMVIITKGVTLDLNGNTLTAGYLVAFNGNHVVDNGETKGVLKINQNNISLASDNAMMPVWNEADGYMFVSVKHQYKVTEISDDTIAVIYRPSIGTEYNTLFANGAADNGIKFVVRFEWTTTDGDFSYQDFVLTDSGIAYSYTNNKSIQLTVNGLADITNDVTVSVMVVSHLNVETVSQVYTITAAEVTE